MGRRQRQTSSNTLMPMPTEAGWRPSMSIRSVFRSITPCLPPVWYKSAPYRSRVVSDPRSVLAEFGLNLSEDVEIRVWDSTAELRYLVLPERPAGTEGMDEAQLAELVHRDAMIGVSNVQAP